MELKTRPQETPVVIIGGLSDKIGSGRSNMEWRRASTLPLPAVLRVATHHMSMRSGSTYEAAMMGVPSALLCPTLGPGQPRSDKFQDLRETGYARLLGMEKDCEVLDWPKTEKTRDRWATGSPVDVEQALKQLTEHRGQ